MAGLVPIGATRHRIRSRIAGHFLARHAVSAGDAIAYVPTGWFERRHFAALQRTGTVREPIAGRYYFDLATHYDRERRRHRILVPVAILLPVLSAIVATMFYRG